MIIASAAIADRKSGTQRVATNVGNGDAEECGVIIVAASAVEAQAQLRSMHNRGYSAVVCGCSNGISRG